MTSNASPSLAHYVSLGRTGLRVSPLCLGTMTFGQEWGLGADAETSARLLEFYVEQGGNFVDTANVYNRGHSEDIIGRYLSARPGLRHRLVLATKFGGNMQPGDPNSGGGSRKAILAACDASLKRLQTDYIDLYWQHWEDPFAPLEETWRTLEDLVTAGKVRYVGYSDTSAWKIAAACLTARHRGWHLPAAIQMEYSLLERTGEGELLPVAAEFGLGVTGWGPLRSGVLSGKYSRQNMTAESAGRTRTVSRHANDDTYRLLDILQEISTRLGTTVAAVALAWVRSRPGITAPIIGARTPDQLKQNLATLSVQISPADLETLNAATAPRLNFPAHMLSGANAVTYPQLHVNGQYFSSSPMEQKKNS